MRPYLTRATLVITAATGALQKAKFMRRRGRITVLDHAGLERTARGRYRLVRGQFDRLPPCP